MVSEEGIYARLRSHKRSASSASLGVKRGVTLQVSHSLTQSKKERLTEVVSPSTLCNQPFQPVDFTLPLANEDAGVAWLMLRAGDGEIGACAVLGAADCSWCPRRGEQERWKRQVYSRSPDCFLPVSVANSGD